MYNKDEVRKCKELKDQIFNTCKLGHGYLDKEFNTTLREKMWIQTTTHGYEFAACKVVCAELRIGFQRFVHIEIYNDDGGIHCSADLLDSRQMKELARLVADARLS